MIHLQPYRSGGYLWYMGPATRQGPGFALGFFFTSAGPVFRFTGPVFWTDISDSDLPHSCPGGKGYVLAVVNHDLVSCTSELTSHVFLTFLAPFFFSVPFKVVIHSRGFCPAHVYTPA